MDLVELMRKELLRRNYSLRTVESYVFCLKKFLIWCNDKEPRKIAKGDVKDYLDWLCEKKLAANTLNLNLQAIKFALQNILNKRFFVNLHYSKLAKRLPEVLTQEEVLQLFAAIKNPKHSLMVRLMYSAGLRVSELVNLKVKDFEFNRNYGWVRKGKGSKDRLFVLSGKIKHELIEFVNNSNNSSNNALNSQDYVFGSRGGHLTSRTVYAVVKSAAVEAGLNKRVHPHTLRHSFATHLIENGTELIKVQALMGHNSPETTMVYVHMASPELLSVTSPYDWLQNPQSTS